jgi:hypothetical protein
MAVQTVAIVIGKMPCPVILDALFCLGSVIHRPNQPAANGMACKPSCEAAGWDGLDRASSQASLAERD